MEAEATVRSMNNGMDRNGQTIDVPVNGKQHSVELDVLKDRREKMMQGLNSLKADLDAMKKQIEDQEVSISRTEGALILLSNLITEIDPTALQQQGR